MKNLMSVFMAFGMLFFLNTESVAQAVNQGAWILGGDLGFSSTKVEDADEATTRINISPTVGYFIIDDLAVGLGVDFRSISFDGESSTSTSLGPLARYYVYDAIFAQAQYILGLDDGDDDVLRFGAGYSFFLNDGIAVEPIVSYSIISGDNDFSATSIGLSIGLRAFLGRE